MIALRLPWSMRNGGFWSGSFPLDSPAPHSEFRNRLSGAPYSRQVSSGRTLSLHQTVVMALSVKSPSRK